MENGYNSLRSLCSHSKHLWSIYVFFFLSIFAEGQNVKNRSEWIAQDRGNYGAFVTRLKDSKYEMEKVAELTGRRWLLEKVII